MSNWKDELREEFAERSRRRWREWRIKSQKSVRPIRNLSLLGCGVCVALLGVWKYYL